jgi:hypothetical protein
VRIAKSNNKVVMTKREVVNKAIEAYKLFSEGKTAIEVAIELGLGQKETNRLYPEFWRLNLWFIDASALYFLS